MAPTTTISHECVSSAGLTGWIRVTSSYLAPGDSSAGFLGVGWSGSSGEQLAELMDEAQPSDEVLTLQECLHSSFLLMLHDVLGLCGVVLHVLGLRKESRGAAGLRLQ